MTADKFSATLYYLNAYNTLMSATSVALVRLEKKTTDTFNTKNDERALHINNLDTPFEGSPPL